MDWGVLVLHTQDAQGHPGRVRLVTGLAVCEGVFFHFKVFQGGQKRKAAS